MPKVTKTFILDVNPSKFLDACTPEELIEIDMLLGTYKYQTRIKNHIKKTEKLNC